jgi:2-polyprenyl-6-methoxyphenol hydroxylase-like FAD-dependent oxidoreductase
MSEPIKADVIIVGAGLVGASLALALKNARVSVVVIEAKPPASVPADNSWDNRVYAINPGSEHFLRELGVWQKLDATRCAPIEAMVKRKLILLRKTRTKLRSVTLLKIGNYKMCCGKCCNNNLT